jgi:hypothetical protein
MAKRLFNFGLDKKDLPESEFVKLLNPHVFGDLVKFSGHPGAYKVFSFKNGVYKPIRRAYAIDRQGLLYVGGAKDIYKRLYECLWMSIYNSPHRHPVGQHYRRFSQAKKLFPPDSLYVCIIPDERYLKREREIKDEYELIYGEYPFMNKN